jgi:hypothetical protein
VEHAFTGHGIDDHGRAVALERAPIGDARVLVRRMRSLSAAACRQEARRTRPEQVDAAGEVHEHLHRRREPVQMRERGRIERCPVHGRQAHGRDRETVAGRLARVGHQEARRRIREQALDVVQDLALVWLLERHGLEVDRCPERGGERPAEADLDRRLEAMPSGSDTGEGRFRQAARGAERRGHIDAVERHGQGAGLRTGRDRERGADVTTPGELVLFRGHEAELHHAAARARGGEPERSEASEEAAGPDSHRVSCVAGSPVCAPGTRGGRASYHGLTAR